jgi:hypothetical protein
MNWKQWILVVSRIKLKMCSDTYNRKGATPDQRGGRCKGSAKSLYPSGSTDDRETGPEVDRHLGPPPRKLFVLPLPLIYKSGGEGAIIPFGQLLGHGRREFGSLWISWV